jgi:hypothetical protein
MVLLEPVGDQLIVRESLTLHNGGDSPFRDPANGVVRIFLPDAGVESLGVAATAPNQPPVEQKASKTGRPQEYKVDFALPVGDTRFDFSYSVPFRSPGAFQGRILHSDGPVNLVIPQGVSVRGEGLELVGQEPQSKAAIYAIKSPRYKVEIEGSGSMGAAPAAAEDSGPSLEEISPRLYDSLPAILGLALAILALGFILLYRMGAAPAAAESKAKRLR